MTANANFYTIVDHALGTAHYRVSVSTDYLIDPVTRLFAGVPDDEDDLDYTISFVDGVIHPEGQDVATRHLGELGDKNPKFPPWYPYTPTLIGGETGCPLLGLAVLAARRVFARLVDDLVVNITNEKFGPTIGRLHA